MKIEVEHNGEKWEATLIRKMKDEPKIVDMSPLINSGVLCQFSDVAWDEVRSGVDWRYGFLLGIGQGRYGRPFKADDGFPYKHCRPVLVYYHGWLGGECPVPEGVSGKVYFRRGGSSCYSPNLGEREWKHDLDGTDIIGFKIIGLVDGYEWP